MSPSVPVRPRPDPIAALKDRWREPVDPTAFGLVTSHLIYEEARKECADQLEAALRADADARPPQEVEIHLRVPFSISGRLGVGADVWAELCELESRRNPASAVAIGFDTLKTVMAALRHCGEKHYINPVTEIEKELAAVRATSVERDSSWLNRVAMEVRVSRRLLDDAFRFFTGGTIELFRLSRPAALRLANDILELASPSPALNDARAPSGEGQESREDELREAILAYRKEVKRLKGIGLNQYGELAGRPSLGWRDLATARQDCDLLGRWVLGDGSVRMCGLRWNAEFAMWTGLMSGTPTHWYDFGNGAPCPAPPGSGEGPQREKE